MEQYTRVIHPSITIAVAVFALGGLPSCSSQGSEGAVEPAAEPSAPAGSVTPPDTVRATSGGAPASSSPTATGSPSATTPPTSAAGVCDPAGTAAAVSAYESAKPFLAKLRNEEHPSKVEFDTGMGALLSAADAGLLQAQYDYGATLFTVRFTDHAPAPADEADYVRALTFLRAAAMRSHEKAREGYSDLAQPKVPAKLSDTLKQLPRAWVVKAYTKSDEWLKKCSAH